MTIKFLIPVTVLILSWASSAEAQTTTVTGSIPSGPASNEVLPLSLREAIKMAVRYNLGSIESAEAARLERGQRLVALSDLLPQVDAGVSENVNQISTSTLGIPRIQ
jgi:hypothetical protein